MWSVEWSKTTGSVKYPIKRIETPIISLLGGVARSAGVVIKGDGIDVI